MLLYAIILFLSEIYILIIIINIFVKILKLNYKKLQLFKIKIKLCI
jgi:hypothetical protein